MPLTADLLGTNADGSRNMDYCIFCYKDGRFQKGYLKKVTKCDQIWRIQKTKTLQFADY